MTRGPSGSRLGYGCLALLLLAALLSSVTQVARVDEQVHFEQIKRLFSGDFTLVPKLTNIPGYHLMMAGICRLYGEASLPMVRSVNAALGGMLIIVFAWNLRAIHGSVSLSRVVQLACLPILFPLFFLAYTDVLAVLLVLVALLATLRSRHVVAALACGLSVLVRQPSAAWLLLFPVLAFLRAHDRWPGGNDRAAMMRKLWPAALVMLAFAVFVILNHGVALGDRAAHPSEFVVRLGNLFFLLFLYAIVFAPLVIGRIRQSVRHLRHDRVAMFVLGGAAALYLLRFESAHPYNTASPEYFLHNYLLVTLSGSWRWQAVFFIPMAIAIVDLIAAPALHRQHAAILMVSAMSLAPVWMIEQRYYVIPFALLMLFRDGAAEWLECLAGLYSMAISLILLYGIYSGRFFP